ncbi:hypothetical protein ACMSE2_26410 [Bacteroides thetaiotaomicron]|uniref:hypothetical protein n=1 Tax=Bacteroides thetaiotaomicron TaxID=818 RepID=UPI0039C29851
MMAAIHIRKEVISQKKDFIFFLSPSATRFPTPALKPLKKSIYQSYSTKNYQHIISIDCYHCKTSKGIDYQWTSLI